MHVANMLECPCAVDGAWRLFLVKVDRGKWSRSDYVSQSSRTLMKLREMILAGEFGPGERIY
jgi:hypothetical protein